MNTFLVAAGQFLKQNKHLVALGAITLLLVFLPTLNLFLEKDFRWAGVSTVAAANQGIWSYYEARIREIVNGHPFIGNPYFLEHNNDIAPAFFFADWLGAIPRLLGASLGWAALINMIFWSLVFVFLAYAFLRQLDVSRKMSSIGAALSYVLVFFLVARPVSMQIVFPFYLFFLLALVFWLKNQSGKKRMVLLVASAAASFYTYTYFWQIVVIALGLTGLYWLWVGNKKELVALIKAFCLILFFSLPPLLFTYRQITHPDYWETMKRIGLLSTHLPFAETFYSGRWAILMILMWFLGFWWSQNLRIDKAYKTSFLFVTISGLALIIASASNLITGQELELAEHIYRFILLWLPLVLVVLFSVVATHWPEFRNLKLFKKAVISVLGLVYLWGLAGYYHQNYFSELSFRPRIINDIKAGQRVAGVITWLNEQEKAPVVLWVDPGLELPLDGYVSATGNDYVLFAIGGILHLVSSQEVEERYLVANYFNKLTLDDIKRDFKLYAGVADAVHAYKTHNRGVVLCRFFRLDKFGYDCGEVTDAFALKGERYFIGLYEKYTKEIIPNIKDYLAKYQVVYFIKDSRVNKAIGSAGLTLDRVFDDGNFEVYKIKQ